MIWLVQSIRQAQCSLDRAHASPCCNVTQHMKQDVGYYCACMHDHEVHVIETVYVYVCMFTCVRVLCGKYLTSVAQIDIHISN